LKQQREFLIVQHRRDADAVGHFKNEADEGRLHRCADANRSPLHRRGRRALLAQSALGGPRTLGQFADHLGRKARRIALPCVRQHIDEHAFAGRHGVDGHPARQRQPDRRAIGVAPRRRDIIGRPFGKLLDRDIHRALEPDQEDGAGRGHFGLDVLGKLENQPGVAAAGRERGLALDRRCLAEAGNRRADQDQPGGERYRQGGEP